MSALPDTEDEYLLWNAQIRELLVCLPAIEGPNKQSLFAEF